MTEISEYRPEYCELLIKHMKNGFTFNSFGAAIKVPMSEVDRWEQLYPEWARYKDIAQSCLLYHDEELLKNGTTGELEKFKASSHIFKMTAVHGWKTNFEIAHKGESIEQYIKRIKDASVIDIPRNEISKNPEVL